MNSKNTLPITEARKRIFELAENVQKPKTVYFLTQNGRAKAVIVSVEEYESWVETLDIMRDPELVKEIKKTHEDYENGRKDKFITWGEMEKKLGWDKLDKIKTPHVSTSAKKIGAKRSRKGR